MPSNPSKAEAFWNFPSKRGKMPGKVLRESTKRGIAHEWDIKLGALLMWAIEGFCALFSCGKLVLKFYLCSLICFLSHNVDIQLTRELVFSSVFTKYETEKAKQGSHLQHPREEGQDNALSLSRTYLLGSWFCLLWHEHFVHYFIFWLRNDKL